MRGAALVASNGDIDWLCLGRFDADPVLLALLDGDARWSLLGGVR